MRPTRWGRRRLTPVFGLLVGALVFAALIVSSGAVAVSTCGTLNHLTGSVFEIDVDANLSVDGGADCIDWDNSGSNTLRSGVLSKSDLPAGSGDDSFGQGTAEDNPNPTIVDGSIPPNKSDLKTFGVYTEATDGNQFVELFWSRIQNPSGTTNMDFELNQEFCDGTATHCANNAPNNKPPVYVTPKRTAGDKLITYDLAKGGTVPAISIRTWTVSAWGPPTLISGAGGTAIGSVNSSAILAANSGIGDQDAFTFGEAAISYAALFPGGTSGCGTFGSAYLKSRSSDSFPAELKDFIAPEPVQITNCSSLTTSATPSVTIGSPISDDAILTGATAGAGGTITFHLFSNATCTTEVSTGLSPVSVNGSGTYNSGNFTPAAVGTYYWTAVYSGDLNNAGSSTACGDANESSVVGPASPAISTTPNQSSGTVGDVLNDSASLTLGYNPTGTILFKLWPPSNATCSESGDAAVFSESVPVSGNGPYSTTTGYTSTQAGTYHWTASYTSGDGNNNSTASACADEAVVISPASPAISTTPNPSSGTVGDVLNDSASLTLGYNPTGTILFKLWPPSNATCSESGDAAVFSESVPVSGNGPYSTTTGYTSTAVGTYHWTAVYSGDGNNDGTASLCADEAVTLDKLPSTIATRQRYYPNDAAAVTGGTSGNVTFELYGPFATAVAIACTDPAKLVFSEIVALSGGSASTSNYPGGAESKPVTSTGWYGWLVTYEGDASHFGRVSTCGSEKFQLVPTNDPGPGSPPGP